jgi:hypothetical protein
MKQPGFLLFPLWIERSCLPQYLAEKCKNPHAWAVFRKIVELDLLSNSEPGTVEISARALGELLGVEPKKTYTAMKKLRKAGVVRAFLPDNEEEEALFQVMRPLETPVSYEQLRRSDPDLLRAPDEAFVYAIGPEDELQHDDLSDADPVLREVVNLYLDNVSMKMNAFIFDELRLIRSRFDLPLIRKVFAKAKKKEIQTLGWILKEARLEQQIREKAKKEKEDPDSIYREPEEPKPLSDIGDLYK